MQEELEACKAEQLEVEASVAALDAELAENLREQRRDLEDRLAAASSSVDAATLEARRRELQQVGGLSGRAGQAAGRLVVYACALIAACSCLVAKCLIVPLSPAALLPASIPAGPGGSGRGEPAREAARV